MFLVCRSTSVLSELCGCLVGACRGENRFRDRGRKRACAMSDGRGAEETRGEEGGVVVEHVSALRGDADQTQRRCKIYKRCDNPCQNRQRRPCHSPRTLRPCIHVT